MIVDQGLYGSWKTWKVMEFKCGSWKMMVIKKYKINYVFFAKTGSEINFFLKAPTGD